MALGAVAVVALAALVGWRWFLSAHVSDKAHQRAHELELHTRRVVVDQAALDRALGSIAALEARVKTLEYRPR